MKTILIRLLIFAFCAMSLNFISNANFNVEEGKVFVVGRCQVSFSGMTSDFVKNENAQVQVSQSTVGIAQVELESCQDDKPVFKVNRIFSVKTDENGYFMLKNLSNQYTYVLLGIQHQKNIPVPINFLTLANAREKQGKMLNLGSHQISFNQSEGSERSVQARIDTSLTNEHFVNYFVAKSPIKAFVSKIKTGEVWGKSNAVTVVDSQKVAFANLETAPWQACTTN